MSKFKRLIPALLVIFGVMLTQGCMRVETEVTVNKDGSGTIDVTMLFAGSMMSFLNSMNQEGEGEVEQNPFSENKFKELALSYGEDVKLVDYEEIDDGQFIGGRGRFSFSDINAIALTVVPDIEGDSNSDDEPVLFQFSKKGKTSSLKIITPQNRDSESAGEEGSEEETEDESSSAAQMEMMKGFMKDMYISFRVNVDGKIVKTNSSYVDKSRVTIYEIDMNVILADDELFTAFSNSSNNPDLMKELDGKKGIIFEPKSEIEITFR